MPALDSFYLIQMSVVDHDQVRLHAIRYSLLEADAHEQASCSDLERHSILMVSSAATRDIGVYLPNATASMAQKWDARAARSRICMWVAWLRGLGVIRLSEFSPESTEQFVPARYLRDSRIRTAFDLLDSMPIQAGLVPAAISAYSLHEMLKLAAPQSIAALLRDSALADRFEDWVSEVDPGEWPKLLVPLFNISSPLERQASGLRFGLAYWRTSCSGNAFVLGEMANITIDRQGHIAHQDYPIDCYGLNWTPPGCDVEMRRLDPIYRSHGDLALDRVLDETPTLVASVLAQLRRKGDSGPRPPDDFAAGQFSMPSQFAQEVRIRTEPERAEIHRLVRESAFPSCRLARTARQFTFATKQEECMPSEVPGALRVLRIETCSVLQTCSVDLACATSRIRKMAKDEELSDSEKLELEAMYQTLREIMHDLVQATKPFLPKRKKYQLHAVK